MASPIDCRRDILFIGAAALLVAACATPAPHAEAPGCWTNLFSEPGYRGAVTTYTGPSYERHIKADAESLAVGPSARLEGYSDRGLDDKTLTLEPGTRVPDLRQLKFRRRVAAFRLACVDSAQ